MKKIKSFIYLDNYKMYSISSQIFEGLTEYIIKGKQDSSSEVEEQKGKIGSGKILADIIEKNNSLTEKKFLHDYSYILFEEALFKENRVLEINSNNFIENISKINDYNFVKITGRVVFNDSKTIEEILEKFNDIGFALTLIEQGNQSAKNKAAIYETAKKKGLNLDKDYLEKLKYLIHFGYNEQFEILLPLKMRKEFLYLALY